MPPEKIELQVYDNSAVLPAGAIEWQTKLWPKQVQFMVAPERIVLFGGARGPGKTRALCEKILGTMLRWPGIPVLLCRRDLKDLKASTEREWQIVCPKELYDPKNGGQYHKGERWYRFFNGSTLLLGELKDWESYKSMTLGMIAIDELNEIDEEAVDNLSPTLRWTTREGICERPQCAALGPEFAREHARHPVYQIVAATNPAPGWVKTRFWEAWKSGHERPGHRFIPATAFDNPSLPPDFIPNLMETHTATWVQNYIYGDWSAFENMVWERFNRAIHCWKGPVPYGDFVRVEGGIDYGATTQSAHHTAAYLTAELRDGRFVTFWEYCKQGAASADFFASIKRATGQYRVQRWEADSSQHRANEALRDVGVPVYDAPRYQGAVKDGVNLVDRLLTPDATGRPQLYVTENCTFLLSGIETYQKDPVTDEPKKNQEDDAVNAWRYNAWAITRGRAPERSRDIKVVNPAGALKPSKASSILTQVKSERRDRLRRLIEMSEAKL